MKTTLGKLPADAFGMVQLPVIPADIIAGFRALPDLTGMASDAMDELGIVGAIPASVLKPTDPEARLVGRALTVMNVKASAGVPENVAGGVSGMGEIEAHNLADPGDVLVLQGVDQVSNMADETGVCFIPRERAGDVLVRVGRIAANEEIREAKIASGVPVAELLPKQK